MYLADRILNFSRNDAIVTVPLEQEDDQEKNWKSHVRGCPLYRDLRHLLRHFPESQSKKAPFYNQGHKSISAGGVNS
jgi:hypothetical protein